MFMDNLIHYIWTTLKKGVNMMFGLYVYPNRQRIVRKLTFHSTKTCEINGRSTMNFPH